MDVNKPSVARNQDKGWALAQQTSVSRFEQGMGEPLEI